jgi:integrase
MKGSIDKYTTKGSSKPHWRYRIYTGKNEAGVKQYVARAGFEKQGEAADAMRDRIEVLRRLSNQPAAPEHISLGSWLTRWIDNYAVHSCQPKTLERYRQLAKYITESSTEEVSAISGTPIATLKHVQLESALRALLKQKAVRREHISARTVRHVGGVLQVALNEAFRLDLIALNPMLKVKLPSVETKRAGSFSPEQVLALREACRGDWTFTLVELAFATAARRGELLALSWANVDWVGKSVTIARSLEETAAGLRLKSPKIGKERKCSLPQTAIVALQFQRDQQNEHKRQFGKDYQDHDLVFAEPSGDFLQPALVSQVVVRRIRKAGIQTGSLHSLRHTHASNLLSNGVPLPAVSARLGHADVNITARIYAHALPDDDRRAADAWDRVIGPASGGTEPVQ